MPVYQADLPPMTHQKATKMTGTPSASMVLEAMSFNGYRNGFTAIASHLFSGSAAGLVLERPPLPAQLPTAISSISEQASSSHERRSMSAILESFLRQSTELLTLNRHILPGCLTVAVCHGYMRRSLVPELQANDIVITTYGTLRQDWMAKDGLYLELWCRVVLDECK